MKAAKIVRFGQAQVAAQHAENWDPADIGRGIAEQVGLACHVSPSEGSRRLTRARASRWDLPSTLELMAQRRISEWSASQVITETRHLDGDTRREIDRRLVDEDRIDQLSVRAVANRARARACAADPVGFTERGRTERRHRRVAIRPAPDAMAWLSAYLAVEQGVACWAALHRSTDSARASGDRRTRDQIMADILVERLTGQQSADAVPLEVRVTDGPAEHPVARSAEVTPVGLLVPRTTLAGGGDRPGWLTGHGPVPAPLVRSLIARAEAEGDIRWVSWESDPEQSSRGRVFRGRLRQRVNDRDQVCRDPFCGAPARHIDHIVPWEAGGATSFANGRAVCERGTTVASCQGGRSGSSIRAPTPSRSPLRPGTPTAVSHPDHRDA